MEYPPQLLVHMMHGHAVNRCVMQNEGASCDQADRIVEAQDRRDGSLHGCPCGWQPGRGHRSSGQSGVHGIKYVDVTPTLPLG